MPPAINGIPMTCPGPFRPAGSLVIGTTKAPAASSTIPIVIFRMPLSASWRRAADSSLGCWGHRQGAKRSSRLTPRIVPPLKPPDQVTDHSEGQPHHKAELEPASAELAATIQWYEHRRLGVGAGAVRSREDRVTATIALDSVSPRSWCAVIGTSTNPPARSRCESNNSASVVSLLHVVDVEHLHAAFLHYGPDYGDLVAHPCE
jgi:hypothetical protein